MRSRRATATAAEAAKIAPVSGIDDPPPKTAMKPGPAACPAEAAKV